MLTLSTHYQREDLIMFRSRAHLTSTGRAANIHASAHSANDVFTRDGIEWPVSGDETRLRHGYAGSGKTPRLWSAIERYGVNAERGRITIGSVIVTNDGSRLTVTRRGTIAGWGTDAAGRERRWEMWEIEDVIRTA